MERTESKSISVVPSEEQYFIDTMQVFHWNLKSSQEVRTADSHLERRGDTVYSVTNTTNYIKLVFERPYDFPNREKLIQLEEEFFRMNYERKSSPVSLIVIAIILFLILLAIKQTAIAFVIIIGCGFGVYSIINNNSKKVKNWDANNKRRDDIINEANSLYSYNNK